MKFGAVYKGVRRSFFSVVSKKYNLAQFIKWFGAVSILLKKSEKMGSAQFTRRGLHFFLKKNFFLKKVQFGAVYKEVRRGFYFFKKGSAQFTRRGFNFLKNIFFLRKSIIRRSL